MSNRFQWPSHKQSTCPHPSHSSPSSPGSIISVQCACLNNAKLCSIVCMRSWYKSGLVLSCRCLNSSFSSRRWRSFFLRNSSTWSSRLESRHVWSLSLGSTHLLLWFLVSTPLIVLKQTFLTHNKISRISANFSQTQFDNKTGPLFIKMTQQSAPWDTFKDIWSMSTWNEQLNQIRTVLHFYLTICI